MPREVGAVPDVTEAALRLFLEVEPRTVLLTGGSTPRALYERLAAIDYPWDEVECFLSAERCVPPADGRSPGRPHGLSPLSRARRGSNRPDEGRRRRVSGSATRSRR